DALRVAPPELRRHGGVARAKLLMKRRRAELFGSLAPMRAHFRRNVRNGRESLEQRLEIESGATDQDRYPTLFSRFRDRGFRAFEPTADGEGFACRYDAVQAMRSDRLVSFARPRRENAELAVKLHRIGVDDGAAETLGKSERRGGLAARGRPGDENGLVRHVVGTATNLSSPLASERSRRTVRRPDFLTASSRAITSRGSFTFSWVTSTITSPGLTSFCAAGLSGFTSVMITPSTDRPMPYWLRRSSVRGAMDSPSSSSFSGASSSCVPLSSCVASSAASSLAGSWPTVTLRAMVSFLRKSLIGTLLPIGVAATARGRLRTFSIG